MTDKTVIVTGMPAGGTTCVARVVDALGVPMMISGRPGVRACECKEFNEFVVAEKWREVERLIGEFNAAYPQWGFKRPLLFGHLQERFSLFRNPVLIYVMRDVVAVAKSLERQGHTSEGAMLRAAEEQVRMLHLIPHCGVPHLFVSYEKMMTHTSKTITGICEFLGTDSARISEAGKQVVVDDPRYCF